MTPPWKMLCPMNISVFCLSGECLKHGCQQMSAGAPTQAEPKYFNPFVLRFIEHEFRELVISIGDPTMERMRLAFGPQDLTHRKPVDPIEKAKAEATQAERERCLAIGEAAYRARSLELDDATGVIETMLHAIRNPAKT